MKVTVSRDGVVIGVYQRKDIRAAVADGSLNLDDRYFMNDGNWFCTPASWFTG